MRFNQILTTACLLSATCAAGERYWPASSGWAEVQPADARMDERKLRAAVDYAVAQGSVGVLALRGGRIVFEQYAGSGGRDKPHSLASATKSMTSVLVGMAIEEGKLKSLDQPMTDFAPWWKGTDKSAITLRHMVSMTSGLDPKGLNLNAPADQFVTNSNMPLKAKPGEHWEYNSGGYHMLFRVIEKATGENLEAYASRKLFDAIGMEHYLWQKQKAGAVTNYYRLGCTTRDMARFGLLALRGGEWNGKRLISSEYMRQATTPSQKMNPSYGFLWWENAKPKQRFPGSPADTFAAMGARSQNIVVIPSLDLVVVRQGNAPKDADFAPKFVRMVVEAVLP